MKKVTDIIYPLLLLKRHPLSISLILRSSRGAAATCGRAHLCTAVVICGSPRAAPSTCWRGPAGGRAGFSVRCAADFPM